MADEIVLLAIGMSSLTPAFAGVSERQSAPLNQLIILKLHL